MFNQLATDSNKSPKPPLTHVSPSLTMLARKPSIAIEQATSSYSFRFSELSQPI